MPRCPRLLQVPDGGGPAAVNKYGPQPELIVVMVATRFIPRAECLTVYSKEADDKGGEKVEEEAEEDAWRDEYWKVKMRAEVEQHQFMDRLRQTYATIVKEWGRKRLASAGGGEAAAAAADRGPSESPAVQRSTAAVTAMVTRSRRNHHHGGAS